MFVDSMVAGRKRLVVVADFDDSLEKRDDKSAAAPRRNPKADVLDTPASVETRELLLRLNRVPNIDLAVCTGRDRDTFDHLFNAGLPKESWNYLTVIGEFGVVLREADANGKPISDDHFLLRHPNGKTVDHILLADIKKCHLNGFGMRNSNDHSFIDHFHGAARAISIIGDLAKQVEPSLQCDGVPVRRVVFKDTMVAANCEGYVDSAQQSLGRCLSRISRDEAIPLRVQPGAKWLDVMLKEEMQSKEIGTQFLLSRVTQKLTPGESAELLIVGIGDSRPDESIFKMTSDYARDIGAGHINIRVGKTPLKGETCTVSDPTQLRALLNDLANAFEKMDTGMQTRRMRTSLIPQYIRS